MAPERAEKGGRISPTAVKTDRVSGTRRAPFFRPGERVKEPETRKGVGNRTRIALAGLAALGAAEIAGAVVSEQINQQPVSGQTIVEDVQWPLKLASYGLATVLENEVPATFDSTKERKTIGDNNMKRITAEEADAKNLLTPKLDETNNIVTIMSPFVLPPNTTAILDESEYETRTIKHNEPREIVPQGTQIIIPKGMHYRLVGGDPERNENPNLAYGLTAAKYDKETDSFFMLNFYLWDERTQEMIPLATNLPITPYKDLYPNGVIVSESGNVDYWTGLTESNGVTPIAATTSNQLIHITASIIPVIERNRLNWSQAKDAQIQWRQQDGKLLTLAPSN